MKMIFAILLLTSAPLLSASDEVPYLAREYDPAKWPQATLKLSQAGTLKDVFDSGLRPYRFPGLENTVLGVKHVNLTILLGSGKRLPAFPMEWMNIKVFTDGELATIEAATPKLTLEQARKEMLKWLPLAENGRTTDDLDQYLKAAEADFLDFDDPYRGVPHGCSVNWKEPGWKEKGGGPQVVAWFRKTAGVTHPLRLHFKATWSSNRPQKDRGVYCPDPILPPSGYEHVDMTAPKGFGPDSMVDILRSKGVDIGDGKGGISYNEYLASIGEAPPEPLLSPFPPDAPASEESPGTSSWWWTIAGLGLTGILALAIHRGFKSRR